MLSKWMGFIILIVLLCTSSLINCHQDDSEEKAYAVELTPDTFNEAIYNGNYFVKFFAPWCGHCKRLHPLWEELAELLNNEANPKVVISKVDCTKYQELCAKYSVTGYPTLRFFKKGEPESIKFKGTRDTPTITEFINQQLNSIEDIDTQQPTESTEPVKEPEIIVKKLIELTEENFAKHVSSGNHFVKFFAPWCSHCQHLAPTWEELSKTLGNNDGVSIAKIDCTLYRPICQDFEIKGYPTLLWIEDGKKIEKYSGSRELDQLIAYVEKMVGNNLQRLDAPDTDENEIIIDEQQKKQVIQLTADEFPNAIIDGITFIKFYAPWCGHCKTLSPIWDQLAEKLHTIYDNIKIAKVDCTLNENRNLCVEQEVAGYPTLFAYKNGEKQTEYDGARKFEDLQNYIIKFLGHDEL